MQPPAELVIRPGGGRSAVNYLMAGMLAGFGLWIALLPLTTEEPIGAPWAALISGALLVAMAEPFRREARVRTVADEVGLHVVGTWRRRDLAWSEVSAFRLERPSAWQVPLYSFGDAIHVDLHDGTTIALGMTMARQLYRPQKQLPSRLAELNAWKSWSRDAGDAAVSGIGPQEPSI